LREGEKAPGAVLESTRNKPGISGIRLMPTSQSSEGEVLAVDRRSIQRKRGKKEILHRRWRDPRLSSAELMEGPRCFPNLALKTFLQAGRLRCFFIRGKPKSHPELLKAGQDQRRPENVDEEIRPAGKRAGISGGSSARGECPWPEYVENVQVCRNRKSLTKKGRGQPCWEGVTGRLFLANGKTGPLLTVKKLKGKTRKIGELRLINGGSFFPVAP